MPSPMLVYGISGSGKTSFYERVARYLWQKEGKRTRWLLGDGGGRTLEASGAWVPSDPARGFVDVMHYHLWPHPFKTTAKLCEGWFPADPSKAGSELLPPSADTWNEVGAVIIEGVNTMGDYLMGSNPGGLADRASKDGQTYKSGDKDQLIKFDDGGFGVAGNVPTHYMMGQARMLENIQRTEGIPVFVGWTAHECEVYEGKGDNKRLVYVGPDAVGQALTKRIGASFGHTLHLVKVPVRTKVQDPTLKREVTVNNHEHRAYLRDHFDPQGLHQAPCFANARVPEIVRRLKPQFTPEFILADPYTFFEFTAQARALGDELSTTEVNTRSIVLA